MKCTDKNNQIKSTTLSLSGLPLKRANADLRAAAAAAAASLYISSILTYRRELHLFGALSFFPAPDSVFFPWAEAVAVFWALSLGVFCAAAAVVEDLEACAGFEVVLEGCRRRLPSSPAEDE